MDNYLPTLTKTGRPLAPCHPDRARSLVRTGKARYRYRYGIRCIELTRTDLPRIKQSERLQLRLDPGAAETGVAITRDHPDGARSALMTFALKHRGHLVTQLMTKRRQLRKARRHRKTRYRKPRFDNRRRKPDWLPPSLLSRLHNTKTWIARLGRLVPIVELHIETAVFDPEMLAEPQTDERTPRSSRLYRANLRAAVISRDGGQCLYCHKSEPTVKLELDRVNRTAGENADRYDNLVTACRQCREARGRQPLETWIGGRPAKLTEVQAALSQPLAAASHLNFILPRLLAELNAEGHAIVQHSAASAAAARSLFSVEKSSHTDAALTGGPTSLHYIPDAPIMIRAVGRGRRQRIIPDRYGSPRGQAYRRYCRLPRHVQRRTQTPSHRKRPKRVEGIATGDYVKFVHKGGELLHGYGVISQRSVRLTGPPSKSAKAENATVIERNHGYRIAYPEIHSGL